MQELTFQYKEAFTTGLPPGYPVPFDAQLTEELINLYPTTTGLKALPFPVNPIETTYEVVRPFPLIRVLQDYILLFTKDSIARIDIDDEGAWNETLLVRRVNQSNPHIADFGPYAHVATEEGNYLIVEGEYQNWTRSKFKTCCDFKGQLVIGNCNLSYRSEIIGGPNIVAWSLVGSDDFIFEPNHESGWAVMPWNGDVIAVKKLGDAVIVYGTNGIARLTPTSSPVATFGVTKIAEFGLQSRDSLCGTDSQHFFINSKGELCTLVPERALSADGRAPTIVGFEWLFKKQKAWIASYDPLNNRAWFTSDYESIIVSELGVSTSSCTPTEVVAYNGKLYSYYLDECDRHVCAFTSTPQSFGTTSSKTLTGIEVVADSDKPLLCGVATKNLSNFADPPPCYKTRDFGQVYDGYKYIYGTAAFFKYIGATKYNENVVFTQLNVKVQYPDKRFTRGVSSASATESE